MNEEHLIFGMRAVIEAVEAGKEIERTNYHIKNQQNRGKS